MATIYRCDRCHKETNDSSEIAYVTVPHRTMSHSTYTPWTENTKTVEICERCSNLLNDFLEPLPKTDK